MKSRGQFQLQFTRNLGNIIFAAIFVGVVLYRFSANIDVKNVIEKNEIEINRELIYAKVLLSSSDIAYTDENGIHKSIIDINKVKSLDATKLFEKYSYRPDSAAKGYLHYVRIEDLEQKNGKIEPIEFTQTNFPISAKKDARGFPVDIRYADDDIRLGKLYVKIVKS